MRLLTGPKTNLSVLSRNFPPSLLCDFLGDGRLVPISAELKYAV